MIYSIFRHKQLSLNHRDLTTPNNTTPLCPRAFMLSICGPLRRGETNSHFCKGTGCSTNGVWYEFGVFYGVSIPKSPCNSKRKHSCFRAITEGFWVRKLRSGKASASQFHVRPEPWISFKRDKENDKLKLSEKKCMCV